MQDKAAMLKTCIRTLRLPHMPVKDRKALYAFLLLQLYFAGNILSFGFWKSDIVVFGYLTAFYGVWLIGLTLLLVVVLRISTRFGLTQFNPVVFVAFSLPFCFGLWLQTLAVHIGEFWWAAILLFFAMFMYYRFGPLYIGRMTVLMISLCSLSFMGHSEILADAEHSTGRNSHVTDMVVLDKKNNIHVIMFDALTHSAFSGTFLGVRNPGADYLATLDDTIYAEHMGFIEYVPTKAEHMGFNEYDPTKKAWATLFELRRENEEHNYGAFSGRTPSLLTALLRKNGYHIQTGFASSFLGSRKGKYVDHYIYDTPTGLKNTLICHSYGGLLGFCSKLSRTMFDNWFKKLFKQYKSPGAWPQKVMDLIDRAEQKIQGPVFSAFYIHRPVGHTSRHYRTGDAKMFAEYKESFIHETRRAQKLLEGINRLRKRYPDSIFIVSGDHGPWLSRTEKEDRRFRVLDRHAVALALLNASNLCPWSKNWLERQRYLTPSRMLAASLACDGESRKLTEHFKDNEEFIRFGESLASQN